MNNIVWRLEVESIGKVVAESVSAIDVGNARLTLEVIAKGKKAFVEALKHKGVDANKQFTPRQEVIIHYRGVIIPIIVVSPVDHHAIAIECVIRSRATALSLLPRLWREDDLIETDPVT